MRQGIVVLKLYHIIRYSRVSQHNNAPSNPHLFPIKNNSVVLEIDCQTVDQYRRLKRIKKDAKWWIVVHDGSIHDQMGDQKSQVAEMYAFHGNLGKDRARDGRSPKLQSHQKFTQCKMIVVGWIPREGTLTGNSMEPNWSDQGHQPE